MIAIRRFCASVRDGFIEGLGVAFAVLPLMWLASWLGLFDRLREVVCR